LIRRSQFHWSAYLRELLDRYGEQLDVSLAAYNAGPAAVVRWLRRSPWTPMFGLKHPYNETRGYVQHILEHIGSLCLGARCASAATRYLLSKVEPATPPL